MKSILVIQDGGRPNGNTVQLVDAFINGVRYAGHKVEIVSLLRTEVKGCVGCNACRYGKPCIQKEALFIERFYCIAEEGKNPPLGRYEKYPLLGNLGLSRAIMGS